MIYNYQEVKRDVHQITLNVKKKKKSSAPLTYLYVKMAFSVTFRKI